MAPGVAVVALLVSVAHVAQSVAVNSLVPFDDAVGLRLIRCVRCGEDGGLAPASEVGSGAPDAGLLEESAALGRRAYAGFGGAKLKRLSPAEAEDLGVEVHADGEDPAVEEPASAEVKARAYDAYEAHPKPYRTVVSTLESKAAKSKYADQLLKLGSGSYGQVWEARVEVVGKALRRAVGDGSFEEWSKDHPLPSPGTTVAVKVLHTKEDAELNQMRTECDVMRYVHRNGHSGVVPDCFASFPSDAQGRPTRDSDDKHYLILEHAGRSTLTKFMEGSPTKLPLLEVAQLAQQLFAGLDDMASLGLLHNDIKPDNLMVEREEGKAPRLRVIDFGGVTLIPGAGEGVRLHATERHWDLHYAFTAAYQAPELLQRSVLALGRRALRQLGSHLKIRRTSHVAVCDVEDVFAHYRRKSAAAAAREVGASGSSSLGGLRSHGGLHSSSSAASDSVESSAAAANGGWEWPLGAPCQSTSDVFSASLVVAELFCGAACMQHTWSPVLGLLIATDPAMSAPAFASGWLLSPPALEVTPSGDRAARSPGCLNALAHVGDVVAHHDSALRHAAMGLLSSVATVLTYGLRFDAGARLTARSAVSVLERALDRYAHAHNLERGAVVPVHAPEPACAPTVPGAGEDEGWSESETGHDQLTTSLGCAIRNQEGRDGAAPMDREVEPNVSLEALAHRADLGGVAAPHVTELDASQGLVAFFLDVETGAAYASFPGAPVPHSIVLVGCHLIIVCAEGQVVPIPIAEHTTVDIDLPDDRVAVRVSAEIAVPDMGDGSPGTLQMSVQMDHEEWTPAVRRRAVGACRTQGILEELEAPPVVPHAEGAGAITTFKCW